MEIYPTENHLKFSFDSAGVDIDCIVSKANKSLNVEPQIVEAKEYYNLEYDYNLDSDGAKLVILDQKTTQGVVIGQFDDELMQVVIPALSSEADIAYAFHLLRALTELYPDLIIQKDAVVSDFSDKGIEEAIAHCRNNMRIYLTSNAGEDDYDGDYCIRGYAMGTEITIDLLKKQYSISDNETDLEQMIDFAFSILRRLQWRAVSLPNAKHSYLPSKYVLSDYNEDDFDDEEDDNTEDVAIIMNSNLYVNASWSEMVLLVDGQYKSVNHEDFYAQALQSDKIEVLTEGQYAISEMTHEEWVHFCTSVPGKMFDAPKTFILRWNPAISSLTRTRYNHCLMEYGENWGVTWDIIDWQHAKKGDCCYMLLEGSEEEHPGIIFQGVFCCDPYKDKDWRGTDIERYYVDVECCYMADIDEYAWITPQQLENAIPDFNWHSGRSGEQLTVEQAEMLEKLWNSVRAKINRKRRNDDED